jgi:hypothetical protein
MARVKCENNHTYDTSTSPRGCPHCRYNNGLITAQQRYAEVEAGNKQAMRDLTDLTNESLGALGGFLRPEDFSDS